MLKTISPSTHTTADCHPPATNMVSQSVYKEDFRAWSRSHKLQPCKLCDNLKPNEGAFATTTTSKDAYCHQGPVTVTESFKPVPHVREALPSFDGTTNYRSQYITHPVQPRKPTERPIYQPNSAPLTRTFTSHHDFKYLPGEPAKSFKPKVAWERNLAVFDGISEFCDKLKTWPLGPTLRHKAEEYVPPEGRMLFLTTTHDDYTAYECQRPKLATGRPPVQAWVKDKGPLHAKSTTKEDYKALATVRRCPIIQKKQLETSKGAFEKTTTARSAYTPKTGQRAVSCKPTYEPPSSRPRLEDATIYRSSYAAKEVSRCSAQNDAPPSSENVHMGGKGHGVSRPDGGAETPSQSHKRTTCRVSNKDKRAP